MRTLQLRTMAFLALRLTLLPFLIRELLQRKKVTILAYHAPTADVFDRHLSVLKRVYNIVPLSVYVDARQKGTLDTLPRKALIITIDDGHQSNYELKAAIQRHDVPVTIFLCSGVIGTRRRFWFQHRASNTIVQQLKTVPDVERLALLRETGFEETKEFDERQALSAREINELKANVDFQSHTVFHPILPRCVSEKAEVEIAKSKEDLEADLATEVYAFAYPNGDYSQRDMHLVEKAGYKCALTLDRGFNSKDTPLFRLRRTCLPDNADLHELFVKTSGLWGAMKTVIEHTRTQKDRREAPAYAVTR